MQKAYSQIINSIARIYDGYERNADEMTDAKRKKTGQKIQQRQKKFISDLNKLENKIGTLIQCMDQSKALKKNKMREYPGFVKQTYQDIQHITRKKSLMFKVNNIVEKLLKDTTFHVDALLKTLPKAGETTCCGCIGYDGQGKFIGPMSQFKKLTPQWRMLSNLEPKQNVQNFISPKFSEKQYAFIRQILRKNWPKPEQPQVVYKQIIKTVNTGKQSRVALANQYLFGIGREQNPEYGLKIYQEEADQDAQAAAFLGQAYEQGTLLPRDIQKSIKYYQKALDSKQPYGSYRLALALIKGQLNNSGITREYLQKGHKILNQISSTSQNPCPQAMVQLGELYQEGHFRPDKQKLYTVEPDLKKAINYYTKARSLYVPRASNNLGVLYINHKYLNENNPNSQIKTQQNANANIQKGKRYLQEAQLQGFSQAYYNMGCIYETGITGKKDDEEALMCYYHGGLKGDHQAKLKFAYHLMNQTSIYKQEYEDHYRLAHRWLESVVKKINLHQQYDTTTSHLYPVHSDEQKAQALFYLGLMYEYGFGVEKSPKKAFSYYLQSAGQEYPAAKNKIGDCYFSGYGTKQNRQLAMGCYLDAAQLNNSDAMVNLGTIYLNGVPELVQKNSNKAYDFFVKAMDLSNSDAMIHLSYMYKNGIGFENDPEMSKKLLEQAAKNKNSTALYMLKQMDVAFDERVLFNNLDNQFFLVPKKINVNQIVPVLQSGLRKNK